MNGAALARGLGFPLFVPATHPGRITKARASGASFVIADLEDAVAPADKPAARGALSAYLADGPSGAPLALRINGIGTPWFADDLALAQSLPLAGVILPKAESAEEGADLRAALPEGGAVLALVETARGIGEARALARGFDRLIFGSLDYAADLGCAHVPAALAHARAELVLAARLAGQDAPLDGVTTDPRDARLIEADAARAAALGFGGKLLIHPEQIAPARAGFRPQASEIDWARRVLEAAESAALAVVDGKMVDAPVIARARLIQNRAQATAPDTAEETHG